MFIEQRLSKFVATRHSLPLPLGANDHFELRRYLTDVVVEGYSVGRDFTGRNSTLSSKVIDGGYWRSSWALSLRLLNMSRC